jgi:DMSO/TMAO reductase YedYZ molybdopterin-dependent catalytic subunit
VKAHFSSPWHSTVIAARVGSLVGVCFGVCFLTGLLSHFVQHPGGWFLWPAHPVWLYRVTQGVHVGTGLATIPLLLVKLWTVYPALFTAPPVRSALHGLERASVGVLVSSALFELVTGLQNIVHWYPWGFSFPPAHYAVAWVATGSILLHVAVKLPAVKEGWAGRLETSGGPSRRWLLAAALGGSAAVVLATAGQAVPGLRRVSVLAPRSGTGPQGLPVNKTATAAGVTHAATDPGWRLRISGPAGSHALSMNDLMAMPQHEVRLPIACVEGWSASALWRGVRVRDLAEAVGARPDAELRFTSLQAGGGYRVSELPARHVRSDESLVALHLNGETLDLDHGFPCRLIAPSRPGVLQTKWLASIEVLT